MRKIGLVTFATLALGLTAAQAGPLDPHTIVVSGIGDVLVNPDHASVDIGVVTTDKITAKALQANNVEMQRVVAAIKALGIPEDAMQTSEFTINALHPQAKDQYGVEDESVTLGYLVTNKVTISITNLNKVADIIDAAAKAGATSSNSVSFDIKNGDTYYDQALAAAVRNARHRAEVMAAAEHTVVGKMISMADTQLGPIDVSANKAPATLIVGPEVRPSILPGQITFSAGVTVVYAVE